MFSFSSYRAAYITKSDYPLIPIFTVYLLQHAQEVRVKFGQTCPLVVVGQEPDPSPALERVEQGELRLVRGDINHLVFRQVVLFTPKNEQHDRRHETERRSLHAQYTKNMCDAGTPNTQPNEKMYEKWAKRGDTQTDHDHTRPADKQTL